MAIKKRPVSPRQRMINLMYVVLMAMLALNVSTEVLEGFAVVEESLNRTTANSSRENRSIYRRLSDQVKANPAKVQAWFDKATQVKRMSDSLYYFVQELKEEIVREADGPHGDVYNIEHKDDLEAASHVMLAPGVGKGKMLYDRVNQYREQILKMIPDEHQRQMIASNLTTKRSKRAQAMGKNWQEYMFENMPVSAAVTLLSKLQSDIRYAEGEVLHTLVANVDLKDIRVNKLEAFVIPESKTVVSGDRFSAQIVMAAVDTTRQPDIYIGGRKINLHNNTYQFTTGGVGEHSFQGYITMTNGSGETIRRNFSQKYAVVAPSATVSADLMNVLYAGYDNPISISIPGVPLTAVSASMAGGGFRMVAAGRYIARPTTVGKDVTIQVVSNQGGGARPVGKYTFHVRKLPDPIAYIALGTDRFKGGGLSKASLMGATGIQAAIDDGLLDIQFKVVNFETVFFDNMGNAVPMASNGARFSDRQRNAFRQLSRNKRFYISRVTAVGPDGLTRKLPASMEIIVK